MQSFATIEREGLKISVSENVLNSGIVDMLFESESVPLDEKLWWIEVWDKLTDEQQGRLKFILWNEKRLLEEVERQYA